jgi:hypothetical protein
MSTQGLKKSANVFPWTEGEHRQHPPGRPWCNATVKQPFALGAAPAAAEAALGARLRQVNAQAAPLPFNGDSQCQVSSPRHRRSLVKLRRWPDICVKTLAGGV